MKKLRILLTLNNSLISGIENFILELVRNSDRTRFEFTVAVPCNGQIVGALKELGIKCYIFNNNCRKPHNVKGIINLVRILLQGKFDIIHAQAGVFPCVLGYLLGVKLRLEHKHGLDFTEEQRENMGSLRILYESVKKYFVNYTVTVCERDRNYLVSKFGYNPNKVITAYNGVKDISESIKNISKKEITIGTVCRLTYQKAPEYFIEIAKLIEKTETSKNIRYEIWGTGELKETLEKLISKYGLESKVFLMGYMYDKAETLSKFDVFVLTSRYEGIPYVILEAMSAGVPVVTADAGGTSEVIENGRNGILLPRGELKLMADSIINLLNDKKLNNSLKEEAYLDFKNKWTVEKTITKILKIYYISH